MPSKDKDKRAATQKRYDEAHRGNYKSYLIKCHRQQDAELIEFLDCIHNKQGYIKDLIRRDLEARSRKDVL